jgi:hypothetical protein
MAYNPEEEGAPYWARREEHRCRCHWGRREKRHGLHARARPHLRMPLPMGKKRGVPWSARSCAAAPPSAIANVGEEGRSAAADREEEGSAPAASWLIDPRNGASPPSLSRSNGERRSWRSGERDFGSSGRGRVGGVKIRTGGRAELFLVGVAWAPKYFW